MANENVCIPQEMIDDPKLREIFNIKNTLDREIALGKIFNAQYSRNLNKKFEKMKLLKSYESKSQDLINSLVRSETKEGQAVKKDISEKIKAAFTERKNRLKSLQDVSEVKDADIIDIEKMADDIFKAKHGYTITEEQSNRIIELTNEVSRTSKLPLTPGGHKSIDYGIALEALNTYTAIIKDPTTNMKLLEELATAWNVSKTEFKDMEGVGQKVAYILEKGLRLSTSSVFKNMKATLDASFLGIQGIVIATTNPVLAFRASREAFRQMFAKNPEQAFSSFRAYMYSHKRYAEAVEAGARLVGREEQVSSTAAEKIPVLGWAIKRTDNAFSAFLQKARLLEYDRYANNLEKRFGRKLDITDSNIDDLINKEVAKRVDGKNLNQQEMNKIIDRVSKTITSDSKLLKEAASEANKITGTSNLGPAERFSGAMNSVLFAGRFAVSDIRMVTDVLNPTISGVGRLRAIRNLAQNIALTWGTYAALAEIFPNETDIRPNSANFMKFKTADGTWTYPKVKGQWLLQLTSKIVSGYEINSQGEKTKYKDGYGQKDKGDVILRTFRSKLAPVPSVLTDISVGSDFMGNKATLGRNLRNLTAPIFGSSLIERLFSDKDTSTKLEQSVIEFIGGSAY